MLLRLQWDCFLCWSLWTSIVATWSSAFRKSTLSNLFFIFTVNFQVMWYAYGLLGREEGKKEIGKKTQNNKTKQKVVLYSKQKQEIKPPFSDYKEKSCTARLIGCFPLFFFAIYWSFLLQVRNMPVEKFLLRRCCGQEKKFLLYSPDIFLNNNSKEDIFYIA